MNCGHKMRLKRRRAESLGCHDRHPLPRVCLREPGRRDVINWQWRSGLGRVPDLRVRVQVRVLAICVSTSTSLSTWLLHEYESESEYWLMSTSTSTGIWSTFYIKSSIAFFNLWRGNPQILINLRQSYNFPLSMQIPFVNIYLFNYSM